jgi:hypothetical protein
VMMHAHPIRLLPQDRWILSFDTYDESLCNKECLPHLLIKLLL